MLNPANIINLISEDKHKVRQAHTSHKYKQSSTRQYKTVRKIQEVHKDALVSCCGGAGFNRCGK